MYDIRYTRASPRAGRPGAQPELGEPRDSASLERRSAAWRRGLEPCSTHAAAPMPRRHPAPEDPAAYAYLLGLYLGDGCISAPPPACTTSASPAQTPGPVSSTPAPRPCATVCPGNRVCRVQRAGLPNVTVYSKHWHLPLPSARPRQEARAQHRPRTLAAGDRRRPPVGVRPRPDPLRRLPDHQLDDPPRRRRAQALRVPPVLLHQHVDRHHRSSTPTPSTGSASSGSTHPEPRPVNISVARRASVALIDTHVGPKY